MSRTQILVLLILACGMALAGCGKKASRLDPPESVENDTYPLTYPDPATDPKP